MQASSAVEQEISPEPEAEVGTAGEGGVSSTPESGDGVAVGMYHPDAGTRHAGGIAVYVQKVTERLSERREVVLYTEAGEINDTLQESAVDVHQIPVDQRESSSLRAALSGRFLPTDVRERLSTFLTAVRAGIIDDLTSEVDVLVVHHYVDDILLSNLTDVPVVRIHHGFRDSGLGTTIREVCSSASLDVANSQPTANVLQDVGGYRPDGIVQPGVDLDRFHPGVEPAFSTDATSLLFVGRFVENKGIYDLVDAVADLDSSVELGIVGRGETERVRKRCQERGIEDRVRFEGAVPNHRLPGYYAASDVLCNPSHYESFSMVNLEAMACGTPVVATDTIGVHEYFRSGETGVLVPPRDSETLAARLLELLDSPDSLDRFRTRGREVARQYSWDASATKLERLCVEYLDSPEAESSSPLPVGTGSVAPRLSSVLARHSR